MRTLRLFLYFTALVGLLLGISDSLSLALGGSTADSFLANGFVLLALGLGARFRCVGFVPLRASFLLLGFAGILPLLAGFAPLGAAFAAFFFLPLRAVGACISGILRQQPHHLSLLALASWCGWLLTTAWAPGLPGFLLLWLVAAILQRTLPTPEPEPSPPLAFLPLLPPAFSAAGIVLLFLALSPYLSLFDSGALPQDLRRGASLGMVFFLCWFTFGSGFANTPARKGIAALGSLALGLGWPYFVSNIAQLSSTENYFRWLGDPRLHNLFSFATRSVPEEHPVYVPILTCIGFALPSALTALVLRNAFARNHQDWGPYSLAPLLLGSGVAFLFCGFFAYPLFPYLGWIAGTTLVSAAMFFWWNLSLPKPLRWLGTASLLCCLYFPLHAAPALTFQHPLMDAYVWTPAPKPSNASWPQHDSLQTANYFSLPRYLLRNATPSQLALDRTFLFDDRNSLAAGLEKQGIREAEFLFAAALARNPQKICWVGPPNRQALQALKQRAPMELSVACDPPNLGRLALLNPISGESFPSLSIQPSLTRCEGPFDLVFMQGQAMWEQRHSLLRAEILRQAFLRLKEQGLCVFVASPEDFVPGILPQWIQEFKNIFPTTQVFLLPLAPTK